MDRYPGTTIRGLHGYLQVTTTPFASFAMGITEGYDNQIQFSSTSMKEKKQPNSIEFNF